MENKRIIKFRAWWIEAKIMVEVETVRKGGYIEFFVPVHSGEKTWNEIQILDESSQYELMQYTGLKDKNGEEIYEGDLLKKEDTEKPRVVKWTDHNGAYFVLSNSVTEKVDWDDCLTAQRIETYGYEIIGNVLENPELL